MREHNYNPQIEISLYDFYRKYSQMLTATQDYINTLENEVVDEVPIKLPTIKEFKFLR